MKIGCKGGVQNSNFCENYKWTTPKATEQCRHEITEAPRTEYDDINSLYFIELIKRIQLLHI